MADSDHHFYVEWHDGRKFRRRTLRHAGAAHSTCAILEAGIEFECLSDDGDAECKGKTTHVDDESLSRIAAFARTQFGATRLRYKEPDPEGQWQEF